VGVFVRVRSVSMCVCVYMCVYVHVCVLLDLSFLFFSFFWACDLILFFPL